MSIAVGASMAVTAYSLYWWPGAGRPATWALWARQVRHGSGVAILILFVLTAVQAWHA